MTRALALSGGGARIHYHAGALKYLLGTLRRQYDIVTGVSAGAIVAAHVAQYPLGQEATAAEALYAAVADLSESDVFKKWTFGLLEGLWKRSFYTSAPLRKTLHRVLSNEAIRKSGKKLRVGAVCVATGDFRLFTEQSHDIVSAVLASSAFPGVLEPVEIEGRLWFDGGVREITPVGAAISAGADEVDIVVTSPLVYKPKQEVQKLKALGLAARAIDFMSNEVMENDLKLANYTNILVANGAGQGKRLVRLNVIRPMRDLGDTFDFSPEQAAFTRAVGEQDAKRAARFFEV